MARSTKPAGPAPKLALTIEDMRAGVGRLTKRLDELNGFQPEQMQERNPPELTALSTGILHSLAKTFGDGTADYQRFDGAGALAWSPGFYGGAPTPLHEYQQGVAGRVARAKALLGEAIKTLKEDIEEAEVDPTPPARAVGQKRSNKVFVVHGHDDAAKEGLARFLEKIELEAVILHEQPDQGRTIIEKFEEYAGQVGFAVVLLTPDDLGAAKADSSQNARARQNVVFELGYFAGKLGRGKTCLLRKGNVEMPSDLYGVIYTELDPADGWKVKLVKEMKAAGLVFDANKVWE